MWIKVCGIRDCETAERITELDLDAVGLNFYSRSPRVVDIETAQKITKILPPKVARVGVFVNRPIHEVESIAKRCELDHLQIHGDEPPVYLCELKRRLPDVRLVRAWRMGKDKLRSLKTYLDECRSWDCPITSCLVDSHVPGVYGGSGKRLPWNQLARDYDHDHWPKLILAGGLNPSNISEAINSANPWGVDVASGVESKPGVKDMELIKQFISNARNANQLSATPPVSD